MIEQCRAISRLTEESGSITRTFLSPPMHGVHRLLRDRMEGLGMSVLVDAVGNLRGLYPGVDSGAPRLLVGSHLDTVPGAGAFDGVLGVVMAIALVEALGGRRLRHAIEVVGFSDEEGVRFGVPFLGSRALAGNFEPALLERSDETGKTVGDVIREFGLDPSTIQAAVAGDNVVGYLEFHIEQGPVLETLGLPLGIVEAIAGQSRLEVRFQGKANHAGTTPMNLRRDALVGTSEWIGRVEHEALQTPGLVATVGQLDVLPGAGNVIPGEARAGLDIRHANDAARLRALDAILTAAQSISERRGLAMEYETRLNQPAVACDPSLTASLGRAVEAAGYEVHRMVSGAGHDAMILAEKMPTAMLFLRSPRGISHHPDETVLPEDVEAALRVGLQFLEDLG